MTHIVRRRVVVVNTLRVHATLRCLCVAHTGSWFERLSPVGRDGLPEVQQFAFAGAEMFNSGDFDGVPPCVLKARQTRRFVLEAWSARSDLDGSRAQLLASSGSMTFTFDDLGFSASQPFGEFHAAELGPPGVITVTASITNATAFTQAKLVTWGGFRPLSHPPSGMSGPLPFFSLDTMLVGDQYSTRINVSNTINISFSQPGTYFVGICEHINHFQVLCYMVPV